MDFFNKKRVAELEAEILRYSEALGSARKELDDANALLEATKRDDTKPWVQINSDGYDEVKGVKLAMDWNDAFVSYLEELEIKGPTEQAAVQRWLALVNLHLIEQLENDAIENDARGTVKDVVSGY